MREIVPGRLLWNLNSAEMDVYDGNGRGPLPSSFYGTIGDNYGRTLEDEPVSFMNFNGTSQIHKANGVYYTFVENRIEIYRIAENHPWTLVSCEPIY